MEPAPATAIVIFGITGDLAARKLLPALYALHLDGGLNDDTVVVGYARSDLNDDSLRQRLRTALERFGDRFDAGSWDELAARIHYVRGGYNDLDGFERLAARLATLDRDHRLFYTSTPPEAYEGIVRTLGEAGLATSDGWTRLVIEKPFGHDLASAKTLNEVILGCFEEEQVYRIDHYLAKETAQNLAVLRFANTLFEPIWSNRYIDHIQITMTEPMGVEGRGSFYESAGVVRDVFQNHLLQLVALVAMEPPARYDALSVRNEKVKVFDAMACVEPDRAVLGQYARHGDLLGYREEDGVARDSRQATYAAVEFEIRNWRWSGVPFYVRSGKRLEGKASEIVLQFKNPPHIPFGLAKPPRPDRLVLRLVPNEGITFRFNGKRPGQGIDLDRISMNFAYGERFDRPNPDAYETLLHDVMLGDATLFMRADEVEAQWRVVQPLLEAWERGDQQPEFYPAGSLGPTEAQRLLERSGRSWNRPGDMTR
jgi:glucose-6-phosphate 1-dehydrogenase